MKRIWRQDSGNEAGLTATLRQNIGNEADLAAR
jgi:hypothetical protein